MFHDWERNTEISNDKYVFGKENNAGKNRGQQEKRRPNVRWLDSMKKARGLREQEPSRATGSSPLWTSPLYRFTRSGSRLMAVTHTFVNAPFLFYLCFM